MQAEAASPMLVTFFLISVHTRVGVSGSESVGLNREMINVPTDYPAINFAPNHANQ